MVPLSLQLLTNVNPGVFYPWARRMPPADVAAQLVTPLVILPGTAGLWPAAGGTPAVLGRALPRPGAAEAGMPNLLPASFGGDFLKLPTLKQRERRAWPAFFRVTKRTAKGLHPLFEGAQEFVFPFRKVGAILCRRGACLLQRTQSGALGPRALPRTLFARRFVLCAPERHSMCPMW